MKLNRDESALEDYYIALYMLSELFRTPGKRSSVVLQGEFEKSTEESCTMRRKVKVASSGIKYRPQIRLWKLASTEFIKSV